MEKNVILDFLKEKASNQEKSAVPWGDIQFNKAAQFALSYDYALLGISNSIINVYWRRRQK